MPILAQRKYLNIVCLNILLFCAVLFAPFSHAADSRPAKKCKVDLLELEKTAQRLTVKLRNNCPVEKEQMKGVLAALRSDAFPQGSAPRTLNASLGRIVDHPWLSLTLAKAALGSREWDRVGGKPRHRGVNQYVSALLRVTGALDDLLPGAILQTVTVEKVLVQPVTKMAGLSSAPKDKSLVPYDAILWLSWVPSPAQSAPTANGEPAAIPPAKLEE